VAPPGGTTDEIPPWQRRPPGPALPRPARDRRWHHPGVLRAVVFDFDGTLLDTEEPEYRAWAECYADHGCVLTVEEWSAAIGTHGGFDPLAALAARAVVPLPDAAALLAGRRTRKNELLADVAVQPGVLDRLDEAEAMGLAVGVASSSSPEWVEGHLERLGLRRRVGAVACCDGTIPPKPDPTSYRTACERLGVAPSEAVAFEDSGHGVAAAVAAGLVTVAVPHRLTRHLDLSAAHLVVGSLAEASLTALARHPRFAAPGAAQPAPRRRTSS
jgi:HAD superfamily hydrolase (TIGR01509 family)